MRSYHHLQISKEVLSRRQNQTLLKSAKGWGTTDIQWTSEKISRHQENNEAHSEEVRDWSRLPRKTAGFPALKIFRTQLDTTLSNLNQLWNCLLLQAEGWNRYLQSTIPTKIITCVYERNEITVILSLEKNGSQHFTKNRCAIALLSRSGITCFYNSSECFFLNLL